MNLDNTDRLDDVLIPALAFDSPMEVVEDSDLTLGEKRALLAAWASDAQSVADKPALRCSKLGPQPVPVDEILAALRLLDRSHAQDPLPHARKTYRKASIEAYRTASEHWSTLPDDQDRP